MLSGPWGHDRAWERSVIERIRNGGCAPCVDSDAVPQAHWDAISDNADGWEYAEARSKDAIRSGAVYLNDEANARRALQRKLLREGIREAQAEAKARADKIAADQRAQRAAQDEAQRLWEAGRAEREKRAREQTEAWELEADRRRILLSRWTCTICGGKSTIESKDDGYQITCLNCGKGAWGSHDSLWKVLTQ